MSLPSAAHKIFLGHFKWFLFRRKFILLYDKKHLVYSYGQVALVYLFRVEEVVSEPLAYQSPLNGPFSGERIFFLSLSCVYVRGGMGGCHASRRHNLEWKLFYYY
jgi:hypothetical protein